MKKTFFQIGAPRDGREAYLAAARKRNMRAVLVERPEFLALRAAAGRPAFDAYIVTNSPADPAAVCHAIRQAYAPPDLVLAAFERYTRCAHEVAGRLGVGPAGGGFVPPAKHEQRDALLQFAPEIAQPRFHHLKAGEPKPAGMSYPAVLKPVDGGGGLGVMLVHDDAELQRARQHGEGLTNYDGAQLDEWILEEYIEAPEQSVQGLCCGGTCQVLAVCSKVVATDAVAGLPGVLGFREVAHIATPAATMQPATRRFVERALAAVAYTDGPFHIDFRHAGEPVFIEMGFRLSGAAVTDLVRYVSGCDWGEAAFSWMLGDRPSPATAPALPCAANILAFREPQIERARRAVPNGQLRIEPIVVPCLPPGAADGLSADLSRHTGPIARLQITGDDEDFLRNLAIEIATLPLQERNHHENLLEYRNA